MADQALSRPQYLGESGADGEPVKGWLTSRDSLVNRPHRGDRLWRFIGGMRAATRCGMPRRVSASARPAPPRPRRRSAC
jgi:hypothetical protein